VQQFDRAFVGLSGSDSALVAAQVGLKVPPAAADTAGGASGYLVGHSAQVIAVTRDGMARVWYPAGTRQRDWAHDIPRLIDFDG
jgi:cytochrome oxidase Cu insertion factor (SCO1/SenC/PrrC family)